MSGSTIPDLEKTRAAASPDAPAPMIATLMSLSPLLIEVAAAVAALVAEVDIMSFACWLAQSWNWQNRMEICHVRETKKEDELKSVCGSHRGPSQF